MIVLLELLSQGRHNCFVRAVITIKYSGKQNGDAIEGTIGSGGQTGTLKTAQR